MAPEPFQYAVIRVVPRVEREEFINVGVLVFCPAHRYLAARAELDPGRLASLHAGADADAIAAQLAALVRIAAGDPDAGAVAALSPSERFHWLAAPASTCVQTSQIHSGLCTDPGATLEHLFAQLVAA
jgi:hypothetical protein